jgi:hypothetical protein
VRALPARGEPRLVDHLGAVVAALLHPTDRDTTALGSLAHEVLDFAGC